MYLSSFNHRFHGWRITFTLKSHFGDELGAVGSNATFNLPFLWRGAYSILSILQSAIAPAFPCKIPTNTDPDPSLYLHPPSSRPLLCSRLPPLSPSRPPPRRPPPPPSAPNPNSSKKPTLLTSVGRAKEGGRAKVTIISKTAKVLEKCIYVMSIRFVMKNN